MASSRTPHSTPDFRAALQNAVRGAAARWRLERVKARLLRGLLVLVGLELAWLLALVFRRSWVLPLPWAAGGMALAPLLLAAVAWGRRVDWKAVWRGVDRRLPLPDQTLSAGELARQSEPAHSAEPAQKIWLALLQKKTLERLKTVDWRAAWPVPWPAGFRRALAAFTALLAVLCGLYIVERNRLESALQAAASDPRTAAIREMFEDWDAAKADDPELAKMVQEAEPLREKLLDPALTEKQRFEALNELESLVAAAQSRLAGQSLEPQAGALADALQPMDGMGGLAAALRKKDFEKAAELAQLAAERLQNATALPHGAEQAAAASAELAKRLARLGALSKSLEKFSQSAQAVDCKRMAESLAELKACLAQQCDRDQEKKRLAVQMVQLGFAKDPGKEAPFSVPSIGESRGKNPGNGIGTQSDPNRFGDPTKLDSERQALAGNSLLGEGESERTTVQAESGAGEAQRGTRAVGFQEYQRLSQQAIADEALPAAHRETIKRYFERIRPDNLHPAGAAPTRP